MLNPFRKRKPVYFDLDSYDCSSFAREVTEEELYLINGGGTMSSADQAAMAEACKNGDKEAQAEIKAKYETKDSSTTSTGANVLATAASFTANATPQQTTVLATEQQVEETKKDVEKKKSESSLCSSGGGSESGNVNGGSSGSTSILHGNTSNNPYEGRKTVLTSEEQCKMIERKNGVVPTTVVTDNTYCMNNYRETVKYTGGEQIKGQSLSPTVMENLIRGSSNPFEGRGAALSEAEQAEMIRQDVIIKKNTKETKVWIVRNDDGLGNEFNATRYIYKDGKLVYQDVVGANCSEKYYDKEKSEKINYNSTTPDGIYYLSDKSLCLTKQSDGSMNSSKYRNVLALMTNDRNISQRDRAAINFGDRYFHGNQFASATSPYNSNLTPAGGGCIIGMNGQERQDSMMGVLMDGIYNPEFIQVNIVSLSNMEVFKK